MSSGKELKYPADRKYAESHEWAMQSGDSIVVGISDYAQDALGDIVFVELPKSGDAVTAKESFGTVESVKAVSDIYSPVTGEVSEINEQLTSAGLRGRELPLRVALGRRGVARRRARERCCQGE